MISSPIQLLQLSFKRINVNLDPRHAPAEAPNPLTNIFVFDGVSITTEFAFGQIDADHDRGRLFLVNLRTRVDNEPDPAEPGRQFAPYTIDVEVTGVVLVPKGNEEIAPLEDLVSVNGAALLWSATREQVLTLTSRMPVGPVMLPTVHFHDLKRPTGAEASAAPQPVKAEKPARSVRRRKEPDA